MCNESGTRDLSALLPDAEDAHRSQDVPGHATRGLNSPGGRLAGIGPSSRFWGHARSPPERVHAGSNRSRGSGSAGLPSPEVDPQASSPRPSSSADLTERNYANSAALRLTAALFKSATTYLETDRREGHGHFRHPQQGFIRLMNMSESMANGDVIAHYKLNFKVQILSSTSLESSVPERINWE